MQAIDKIISDAQAAFEAAPTVAELEQAKARFLGKSGALTELLKGLGKLPPEEKPKAGAAINEAKVRVDRAFIQSKSFNTPFRDWELPGQLLGTWVEGRKVWS